MLRDGGMDEDSIGKYARKVKKLSDDEFDKLAAHNDPVGRCSRGMLKKYNMSRSEESTQSAETTLTPTAYGAEDADSNNDTDNSASSASGQAAAENVSTPYDDEVIGVIPASSSFDTDEDNPDVSSDAEVSISDDEDIDIIPPTVSAEDEDGGIGVIPVASSAGDDSDDEAVPVGNPIQDVESEEVSEQGASDANEGDSSSELAEKLYDADENGARPQKKHKGGVPIKAAGNQSLKARKPNAATKTGKWTFIAGFVILFPCVAIVVAGFTALFITLFAAVIALVLLFSVALVAAAAGGAALSIVEIGYGVIKLYDVVPVGLYEMGLGIIVGGAALLISILLYNYIVRLAPFLFKKLFKLYVFLWKQFVRFINYVKGACYKL